MSALLRIGPCPRCGGETWYRDPDPVGITYTCVTCGRCRYMDSKGAVVGVREFVHEPDHDARPEQNVAGGLSGVVCTVVRVYRRARPPYTRATTLWDPMPSDGVYTVGVYHTRNRSQTKRYQRRIRWAEVTPALEDDLGDLSRAAFRRTVHVVLEAAWGPGQFSSNVFDLLPWGYSLEMAGSRSSAARQALPWGGGREE